jgi:DNA-binding transcriptional LysR family regulator
MLRRHHDLAQRTFLIHCITRVDRRPVELRQLKIFRVVARTLNFTRAASELGYVQSNVTAQVQALERELGVPLFDRLGRRVVLTDAGRSLLRYAERLLDLEEEAREAVAGGGEPAGSLVVGAAPSLSAYRLPRLLRLFGSRFPRVKLSFRPTPHKELGARVADGSLDVAFLMEGPVRSASLLAEVLAEEPLVVLAPPDHPLVGSARVIPGDLAGEPVVLTEPGCNYRLMFERELAETGVEPAAALEFDGVEAVKQCVAAGMGVAMLPEITVEAELERGELAALRWAGKDHKIPVQMIQHKDKWVSPALAAFLGVSRKVLSAGELRTMAG